MTIRATAGGQSPPVSAAHIWGSGIEVEPTEMSKIKRAIIPAESSAVRKVVFKVWVISVKLSNCRLVKLTQFSIKFLVVVEGSVGELGVEDADEVAEDDVGIGDSGFEEVIASG